MLDQEFLKLVACPNCKGPVELAADNLVARLNQQISLGRLSNAAGVAVRLGIEGGLVCKKDACLFPIRRHVPLMLNDEALPIA